MWWAQSLPNAWPTLNAWLASDTWLIHQWLTFTIELLKIKSLSSMTWNRGVFVLQQDFFAQFQVRKSELTSRLVCVYFVSVTFLSSSATPVLFSELLNLFACLFSHIKDAKKDFNFSFDSGSPGWHPVGNLVVWECMFVLKAGCRQMQYILNAVNLCLNTVVYRMHCMAVIWQLLSSG